MTRIMALCAAEERFDGQGGAVATWLKEIYDRSAYDVTVVCPEATAAYAETLTVNPAWGSRAGARYVSFARALVKRAGKNPAGGAKKLTGGGRLWVLSQLRAVRSYDLIHVHNRPAYCRWLRQMGYRGVLVCHMHNELSEKNPSPAELAAVDHWVFCSDFIRTKAIADYALAPERCRTIHNGVAGVQRRPGGTLTGKALFVGRLVEQKGVQQAVQMWRAVVESGHATDLDIIGTGGSGGDAFETPYTTELRRLVDELSPHDGSQVRLLGPRSHPEVLAAMDDADVFLLPCQSMEAFGLVVLEAMSRGALPVATDLGGIPEVLPEDWPYRVPVESTVEQGAHAWGSILDATDEARAQLRAASSAKAAEFTWDALVGLFDDLVAQTCPGAMSGRS